MQLGGTHAAMPALERGVEHAFEVSLAQTVTPKGGEAVRVAVTGTWAVAYAGSDATGAVFRAELRDVKPVVRRGTVDVPVAAELFSRPYYFTTSEDGRLLALQYPPGMQELARGVLTQLATIGQRSAIGSDTLGDYEAEYREDKLGLHRTRARYARVTGGDAIAVTIVETGTDFALREDGWPNAIRGREVTSVGNGDMTVLAQQEFELRHSAIAKIDPGSPQGLEVSRVDTAAASARAQELADQDLAGDATFSDLMAELAKITDEHARGYQFLRLSARMRLDEKAVDEAARAVAANASNADVIVGALGEAGTPKAQRVLADIIDTPALDGERRVQAAVALGLTSSPTVASLDALAQLSKQHDEVGDTALLAYGNAAMRDEDPADAARRVDDLLARLARATSDDERAVIVRALGNTGDRRILPALTAAFGSTSMLVRVAAVEAMRLVPGAEGMIGTALRDRVVDVRAAAVFAATGRPELRPLLVDVAAHDPEPEVRELAQHALDESGSA
jgi:hypothetical protein